MSSFIPEFVPKTHNSLGPNSTLEGFILYLLILLMVIEAKCCNAQPELLRSISVDLSHTIQAF